MATLASDLVERARNIVYSGQQPRADRLAGALTAVATTLTLTYADASSGVDRGTILAVDLELVRVWAWDSGTRTATVERAVNGTTAATHADLATVEIDPKFSRFHILQAINDDLVDLSAPANGLFRAVTVPFTYGSGVVGYDLTGATSELGVLSVSHSVPGSTAKEWPAVPANQWRAERDMDTSIFPSGFALFLNYGYSDASYRVTYKAQFGALTTLADNVQTVTGLPASANDLPPIGAAINLVFPREVKRNFTEAQGDTRRADEVPAGATTGSVSGLRQRRRERIGAERSRLEAQYPTYMRFTA